MNLGSYGNEFDQSVERSQKRSTLSRMQQQYWEAKQILIRKLKKKEDDCVVNSDLQLDAKLELFHSIEETCANLLLILEGYQDRLCSLSYEESSFGRFLKEAGKVDKTRAGKLMSTCGKTMSYTAQQRILLRTPLVRLYQEVETFQYRAITDTFITIEKMEKARNAYRAALLWMKNISQELDPDTYKQLEKFRKVQAHVRRTKLRFDKLKLDTIQKIDMLTASRCNMLSHYLSPYQNSLLTFWEKTATTMNTIVENFQGYQYYEFSILKELTQPPPELESTEENRIFTADDGDRDKLIFFEAEYRDEEANPPGGQKSKETKNGQSLSRSSTADDELINLDMPSSSQQVEQKQKLENFLSSTIAPEDISLLSDFLSPPPTAKPVESAAQSFLPSHLLELEKAFANWNLEQAGTSQAEGAPPKSEQKQSKGKESDWFALFAELDPLSNPDAIGKKTGEQLNC